MDIKIDSREIERAQRQWIRSTGQSVAAAINETFIQANKAAAKDVPLAKRGQITKYIRSDVARRVALKRLAGKVPSGVKMSDAVTDYLRRVAESKRGAVRFTRLLVNAAAIKASGRNPKRPAGVMADGQKASRSAGRSSAWVQITYQFKAGNRDRKAAERIIKQSYAGAMPRAAQECAKRAARYVERQARRAGL